MFAHAPRLNILAKWLEDQSAQTGIISVFAFGGASDLRCLTFFIAPPRRAQAPTWLHAGRVEP
jgi:hypothetical protein